MPGTDGRTAEARLGSTAARAAAGAAGRVDTGAGPGTGRGRIPGRRGARGLGWSVTAGLAATVLTGCVSMPADGPSERVEVLQAAGAENLQVRVFPVPPHPGEDLANLLTGFLDASSADEPEYTTASKYLSAAARSRHRWNPEAGVTVLVKSPSRTITEPKPDDVSIDVPVSGTKTGQIDAAHTYRSVANEPYQEKFTFVKEKEGPDKGEWRIDQLPDGLIVDQTGFRNGYRAAHRYFYTTADSSAGVQRPVLVPDPIYLRRRTDPLTAAARALADGPSAWLGKAVYSAFNGAKLVGDVSVNDSRVISAKVDVPDFGGQPKLCQQMASQLYFTLLDQQGKGQIDRLDLGGIKGGCSVNAAQAQAVAPGSLAVGGSQSTPQAYYLSDAGKLMQTQSAGEGAPVLGELGQPKPGQPQIGAVAVRRDGAAAAAISVDQRQLFVAGLGPNEKLGSPVLTSAAARPDQGLTSPSWDGRGDLWVVDRNPAGPKVLMVRGRSVVPVSVGELGGRAVQALRMSSDGVRVALVLVDGSGARTLMVGLVAHSGTSTAPEAQITGLRPVAPLLSEIASVSWADTDQLLVLGKEPGKLQQLHYVGTDGSQNTDSPLQGGESMIAVSAAEVRSGDQTQARPGEQTLPVLAVSKDNEIYRLQGSQWREAAPQHHGTSFGYPG
ncbi:LpqB family beta-propeller domain-containing protein [Kitasatospora sp. NPDC001175]|uniref:LpqB family beta-propeller domain-containing protein n=1 Tax=Kitasatospora sp. NPDC001175 TaxID=3157103 RepID=UPI003CFD5A96